MDTDWRLFQVKVRRGGRIVWFSIFYFLLVSVSVKYFDIGIVMPNVDGYLELFNELEDVLFENFVYSFFSHLCKIETLVFARLLWLKYAELDFPDFELNLGKFLLHFFWEGKKEIFKRKRLHFKEEEQIVRVDINGYIVLSMFLEEDFLVCIMHFYNFEHAHIFLVAQL